MHLGLDLIDPHHSRIVRVNSVLVDSEIDLFLFSEIPFVESVRAACDVSRSLEVAVGVYGAAVRLVAQSHTSDPVSGAIKVLNYLLLAEKRSETVLMPPLLDDPLKPGFRAALDRGLALSHLRKEMPKC